MITTPMSGWCDDLFIICPEVPFNLNPNQTADVIVTFSPTSIGICSGLFEIFSNDPDENKVEVLLQGTGVRREIPPEGEIENILDFFDDSVENGDLIGPGNSATNRLNALRNMLEAAGDLITTGDFAGASQ